MPEREHDSACQCIHVYVRVLTGSRLQLTGHMSRTRAAEGVQLSSIVPGMGHHLNPRTKQRGDRASETTVSNCFLSVWQMGDKGIHAEGFYIFIPAVQIYKKIFDMILNVHTRKPAWFWTFFRKSFFSSVSLAPYFYSLSFFISLWCNTRPCAATTGSPELTNPCEGSHGSCKPSLGRPTWGSVLWMFPWGARDMG